MFFFFIDPAPTEIYTLSLHDALPIYNSRGRARQKRRASQHHSTDVHRVKPVNVLQRVDRKSTRLNSSHRCISYAVFCLKKKRGPYFDERCCSIALCEWRSQVS